MIARIRKSMDEKEQGFTLIELLVVIIIIGILAAIAIPVFLNQRQKGWDAAAKSDLKNMATAEETWLTDQDVYSGTIGNLVFEGFNPSYDSVSGWTATPTAGALADGYVLTTCSKSNKSWAVRQRHRHDHRGRQRASGPRRLLSPRWRRDLLARVRRWGRKDESFLPCRRTVTRSILEGSCERGAGQAMTKASASSR